MRIALAGFHIESAAFLPQVSSRADFEEAATRGADLIAAWQGTNTAIGGFIDIVRDAEMEIVPLVYTYLGALGPASDDAVLAFSNEIAESVRQTSPDGVLLHLHGASWAEGFEDVERHFIDLVRDAVGPDIPVVVALDYHGNIDSRTLAQADAAFGYHHSPHTDMGETGRRAARCIVRMLRDGVRPAMAVARPGLAVPSIFSATARPPLAGIIARARQMEARCPGWLDISVMAGFSYADAHNTGFSVIAVADDAVAAAAAADEISDLIGAQKEALYRPERVHSVDEAVALALEPPAARPLVLLEHADRTNDSTYLLSALVDAGADGVAVPMLWDSAAAQAAHAAGQGARVELEIGGWSSPAAGPRRVYECEVLRCGPLRYEMSGPMLTGMEVDLGMTALVRIGGVTVSLVSAFAFAVDEDAFTIFGQEMRDFSTIVLRSKTHFRAVYEPLAERIVIVDTPDHGPADLTRLPYTRLDRANTYPFAAR